MNEKVFIFVSLFLVLTTFITFFINRSKLALIFNHEKTKGENIGTELIYKYEDRENNEKTRVVKIKYNVNGSSYVIQQPVFLITKGEYNVLYNKENPNIASTVGALILIVFALILLVFVSIFFLYISF